MTKSDPLVKITRYQRLLEISNDLTSTLDLNELLSRIVGAAADMCSAQAASILLYDAVKHELRFEIATNMDNPLLRGISVPVDSSIAGWMVTNRQPIIISDAQKDQRHFGQVGEAMNMPTGSMVGVPLIAKDKVIGALEAINKLDGDFTQEDQDLLMALGAQAAIAIENTRLFQQSDQIAELIHELRTPMASLNTAVHLLNRSDLAEEQRQKIIAMVGSEIERLSELTTAFLDLSKLESGRARFQSESCDIRTLLEDSIEMMRSRAAERNISLRLEAPQEIPPILADIDKIKQVMLNLLSNAVKYNFPGGSVVVGCESQPEQIAITVTDSGPGISAENLQRMFEKFYRVPGTEKLAPGTGLGLSICKRIVEMHGGNILITSKVGTGTTFTVNLPAHHPQVIEKLR